MRHVLRERQREAVLAITDQAAPQGGLERVTSRRLRRLVALSAAILSFGLLPGTANAWTLSSTQSFPFAGTFEPIIVPNLIGPAFGCSSGTETNCKFFMFQVAESGTATLNLSADLGSSVDASVDCNGEVDEFGFPVTRAITSTDPFTGQAPPMDFAVVAGDVCTIRVSVFDTANPLAPVSFSGFISLTVVTPLQGAWVSGGGQVLDPNTSFTSNAKPKKTGFGGTVRFFTKTAVANCKYQSTVIDNLVVNSVTSGGVTYKQAIITGRGRVNTGSGWTDDPVEFNAKAEDHGKTGDRFAIDKCGGVDSPITSGQIVIHDR